MVGIGRIGGLGRRPVVRYGKTPGGVVHPGSVPRVDSGPAADTVLPDQCKPLIQSGTSQRWRARSALRVASSQCLLHCLGKAGVRLRGWCQTPLHARHARHARHAGQPVGRFVYAPTPCCATAAAPQMPVEQLPESTRVYLLGSRCCETDWLSQIAWLHCGHAPPSGPGCRASATWCASTLPPRPQHPQRLGGLQRAHRRVPRRRPSRPAWRNSDVRCCCRENGCVENFYMALASGRV